MRVCIVIGNVVQIKKHKGHIPKNDEQGFYRADGEKHGGIHG